MFRSLPRFFGPGPHGAGLMLLCAALLASSAAVSLGLLMGGRLLKGRGPDLRVTHEALSLATIVALLIHALSLQYRHEPRCESTSNPGSRTGASCEALGARAPASSRPGRPR